MPRFDNTSAPLGSNATYTSGNLQIGLADRVVGSVFADQVGVLHIEQSFDNTNWDVDTTYNVVASTGKGFSEEIILPYVRVRYVNGAAAQTVFRLYTRVSSAGSR